MQNTKPLLAALLIAAAMPVQAQSLPAPLFATPGTADASSRAATTAWVRGQSYLSSVTPGQVATALGFVPQRASVFNVLDYGAVADGVTDIGPALRTIAAKLNAGTANVILIPAGSYALNSAVVFSAGAPIIEGQGYNEGANPTSGSGTWLTINATDFVPITFSGAFARGGIVRNIAITQVHPSQVSGWTPTNYDYVFKVLNTLGEVTFDNVLFAGVNRGIYADNSGRLLIRKVTGQFFTAGVEIDDCYDIPRIDYLHAWTYATTSPYVLAWQEAHLDTVILRRVDGIFIGDLFTLGARTALYLTTGANGVTTKLYANSIYADFSKYAVLADGNGISGQFGKVTTQHQDFAAGSGAVIAASRGMLVTGNTDQFQVDQWRSNSVAGPAIDVEGYNNRVTVSDLWANTFFVTSAGDGTPAVFVADSGVNPANFVQVQGTPFLQGTAPLYLYNAGVNAGRLRMPSMNAVGNDANEPRLFSNSAGNPVSVAAIGGDASVDLQLQAKSVTGSVKLQANGQTVVRVDDANSGTDDVLFRSGAGTMNLIAEGADTNIDYFLTPKGAIGGVRLQANALTTLRTDNPNGGNTDLLVRPGTGTINLVTEGGTSGIADMTLTGLGATGGVRLLANGTTIFRVDNPNAVADDLLVRAGASTMALTAEGSDTNISLVLNPKGLGTVALGTSPNLADNSPNLVTSAWVKGQGYGTGSGAVTSVAGRTGIVTLTHSDLTDWATATGTFLTSITSSQVTTALGYIPTSAGITALTGDATASGGGSDALTLATVNSNIGTCGDATHVGQHTLNAKGLTTACTSIAIPAATSSIAGLITIAAAAAAAPVQSYNGRTGAVVPTAGDIATALGFTPYSAANPNSYIAASGAPVQSIATRTGAITLTHSDLTDWATATGTFLTGITSSQVSTALGYTPTSGGITALTGDGTASGGGSDTLALATVNGNVGAFGSSTSVPTLTVNGKGLVTAASAVAIPAAGTSTAGLITMTAAAAAAPVQSVNGGTGAVTGLLTTTSAAAIYAPLASPTHTGTVTVAGSANNATITGAAAGNAAVIAATGTDASVDLWEVAQGSAGGVRFRANGVLTLRTDSPGAGTSDLLVRSGSGAVALTVEGAANGNLVLNPAGTGTVVIPTLVATDNSTNAASTAFVKAQGFLTSGVLQVDTFTASGTWTLNPAAKYIRAILIGCGSSGAGGITATAGTAYSGGAGGSAAAAIVIEGPAALFVSGAVTLCTASAGGAAGAAGIAGGSAVWSGHTAFGGGAPASGSTAIAAGGGTAGYRGVGGNASGATPGTAGFTGGSTGAAGANGTTATIMGVGGNGGGSSTASAFGGGGAVAGPGGGGAGGNMAATQALVAGGSGGPAADTVTAPAGGSTAGAAGASATNTVEGYGSGGGGGANNTAGTGGTGGIGGTGGGGGGGGDGSTAGGTGGAGGGPLLRVVQW